MFVLQDGLLLTLGEELRDQFLLLRFRLISCGELIRDFAICADNFFGSADGNRDISTTWNS